MSFSNPGGGGNGYVPPRGRSGSRGGVTNIRRRKPIELAQTPKEFKSSPDPSVTATFLPVDVMVPKSVPVVDWKARVCSVSSKKIQEEVVTPIHTRVQSVGKRNFKDTSVNVTEIAAQPYVSVGASTFPVYRMKSRVETMFSKPYAEYNIEEKDLEEHAEVYRVRTETITLCDASGSSQTLTILVADVAGATQLLLKPAAGKVLKAVGDITKFLRAAPAGAKKLCTFDAAGANKIYTSDGLAADELKMLASDPAGSLELWSNDSSAGEPALVSPLILGTGIDLCRLNPVNPEEAAKLAVAPDVENAKFLYTAEEGATSVALVAPAAVDDAEKYGLLDLDGANYDSLLIKLTEAVEGGTTLGEFTSTDTITLWREPIAPEEGNVVLTVLDTPIPEQILVDHVGDEDPDIWGLSIVREEDVPGEPPWQPPISLLKPSTAKIIVMDWLHHVDDSQDPPVKYYANEMQTMQGDNIPLVSVQIKIGYSSQQKGTPFA